LPSRREPVPVSVEQRHARTRLPCHMSSAGVYSRRSNRAGAKSLRASAILVLGLILVGGCSRGSRVGKEVSGHVTFQKQPLAVGMIEFLATTPEGNGGGAIVHRGRYAVPPAAGLSAGNYRVRITSKRLRTTSEDDTSEQGDRRGQPATPVKIPEKYNTSTVLTAEVKSGGPQTIDFDLE
jgi:hypothetical protein